VRARSQAAWQQLALCRRQRADDVDHTRALQARRLAAVRRAQKELASQRLPSPPSPRPGYYMPPRSQGPPPPSALGEGLPAVSDRTSSPRSRFRHRPRPWSQESSSSVASSKLINSQRRPLSTLLREAMRVTSDAVGGGFTWSEAEDAQPDARTMGAQVSRTSFVMMP
jgi:hypothetical protein